MEDIVIDAEGCVAGRVASIAAKELLKGRNVKIVNAEKAVVTGSPEYTKAFFRGKVDRGDPYAGPFYPKTPDRILKRIVRGMIPHRKPMGKRAFKRLRVYLSVPEELAGSKARKLNLKPSGNKLITLGELSRWLK